MSQPVFDFPLLASETIRTLFHPREYFAAMPKEGGFGYPLFKVVVYAVAAAFISSSLIFLSPLPNMGVMGFLIPLAVLPVVSIVGIFISSAVLLVLSLICRGDTRFQPNLRAASSVGAMMPVQVAIASLGLLIPRGIVFIISLIAAGYVLYLTYCALTAALNGTPSRAKIIVYCFAGLYVLLTAGSWVTGKAVRKAAHSAGFNIPVPVTGVKVPVDIPIDVPSPRAVNDLAGVLGQEMKQMVNDEPEIAKILEQQMKTMSDSLPPEQRAITQEYIQAAKDGDTARMEELMNRMLALAGQQ